MLTPHFTGCTYAFNPIIAGLGFDGVVLGPLTYYLSRILAILCQYHSVILDYSSFEALDLVHSNEMISVSQVLAYMTF